MDKLKKNLTAYLSSRSATGDDGGMLNHTYIGYGTAGFRGQADKIQHLFNKCGLVAGLRCLTLRANIGIMVTASHNPVEDNGVKLIDSSGEMLETDWEPIVEDFCNTPVDDVTILFNKISDLLNKFNITLDEIPTTEKFHVLIGHDTRPSCEPLVDLLLGGLKVWSDYIVFVNYDQLTTPALHYLVAESNKRGKILELQDYYNQLIEGLADIFDDKSTKDKKFYTSNNLIVDCANGVGHKTMQYLCNDERFNKCIQMRCINTDDGILNHLCGADFVKTKQQAPLNANESSTNVRYAALDGDADRLVYFYLDNKQLRLLDGDKIMALYAMYIKDVLHRTGLVDKLSLGVVQTAYANGASTDYLENQLGLSVVCVDTGVKNLHRKALDYDFAIYFEANGHGTIWISNKALAMIQTLDNEAGRELKRMLKILNNYTGDAISDILIAETILNHFDLDIESWYKFYEDRPNSLIKILVQDHNKIKTTNAGRTCLEPKGLQEKIDSLVNQYMPQSRCFIRASGTEDVARIYAEARNQKDAEELAKRVGELAKEMCNTSG